MFKRVLSILVLGSLPLSLALAQEDVLALVSKGKVTSESVGVTKLNTEEKKQVKGGYRVGFAGGGNEIHAIMVPSDYELKTLKKNGNYFSIGLCGEGQSSCSNPSQRRGVDWLATTGTPYHLIGFTVRRHVGYSRNGRYIYFSYGTAIYNIATGTAYSIGFTPNNMIVNEIRNQYKKVLESRFR